MDIYDLFAVVISFMVAAFLAHSTLEYIIWFCSCMVGMALFYSYLKFPD